MTNLTIVASGCDVHLYVLPASLCRLALPFSSKKACVYSMPYILKSHVTYRDANFASGYDVCAFHFTSSLHKYMDAHTTALHTALQS